MGKLFSKHSDKSKSGRSNIYSVEASKKMDNSRSFKQHCRVHDEEAVMCVTIAEQGKCLTGSKDKTAVFYDYEAGDVIQQWNGHEKEVTKVAYSTKLRYAFTASRDGNINLLMPRAPDPIFTFKGHEYVVNGLALSPDHTQICSGSRDNTVRIWDIDSGRCTFKKQIPRNLVTHVCWAQKEGLIAQTSEDKEVKLFNANNLEVIKNFPKKQYIQTWCDISPDCKYCVSCSNGFGGSGCEVTLWDLRQGSIIHEFHGHTETCNCSIFLPPNFIPGRNVIATSSNDCTVRLWDRETRECFCSINISGSGPITSIAASQQDKRLLVSTFNLGVQVLELAADQRDNYELVRVAAF